jgi:hypothetical protein
MGVCVAYTNGIFMVCKLNVGSSWVNSDGAFHVRGYETSCQTGHVSVDGACISWVPEHAMSMASLACMLKGMHADAISWFLTRAVSREIHACLRSQDLARVSALKLA